MPAASACGRQTCAGALYDQFAFELREAGEDREDQPAVGSGGGVDRRAFALRHLEADAALRQIVDHIDEVAQFAAEPVELQMTSVSSRRSAFRQASSPSRLSSRPDAASS
jgi:hypothetical protein